MEAAAEFCENEIGFDDNNEASEAVYQPEIDTDADHLAEAANLTAEQAEAALVWMRERYEQDIQHAAGDALSRLLAAIIPAEGRISPQIVGMRVLSVPFLLNRIGNETLTSLAARCGVSKQLLNFHSIAVADKLGFHGFAQKRTEARASYAEAQRQSWSRLTPEQRKARRAGKNNAQSTTRNLTSSQETECEHTSQPPNSLGL